MDNNKFQDLILEPFLFNKPFKTAKSGGFVF